MGLWMEGQVPSSLAQLRWGHSGPPFLTATPTQLMAMGKDQVWEKHKNPAPNRGTWEITTNLTGGYCRKGQ